MRGFNKTFQDNVIFEMETNTSTIFLYKKVGFLTVIPHAVL